MFFQSKPEEFTENLGKILEKCLRGISLFSKVAGCMSVALLILGFLLFNEFAQTFSDFLGLIRDWKQSYCQN